MKYTVENGEKLPENFEKSRSDNDVNLRRILRVASKEQAKKDRI